MNLARESMPALPRYSARSAANDRPIHANDAAGAMLRLGSGPYLFQSSRIAASPEYLLGVDLPLVCHPTAIKASARLLLERTLDRQKLEFSGSLTTAGWSRRRDLAS